MIVLVWLALTVAVASFFLAAVALGVSLRRQAPAPLLPSVASPALPAPSPLEGLTVVLAISQDHAHPVFTDLLSETLRKLDAEPLVEPTEEWDLMISGTVTCNGYAEVYYRADLTCASRSETICTMIENPASGDRQANLARELVSRIEAEITKRVSRNERRLALRELREVSGPGN